MGPNAGPCPFYALWPDGVLFGTDGALQGPNNEASILLLSVDDRTRLSRSSSALQQNRPKV